MARRDLLLGRPTLQSNHADGVVPAVSTATDPGGATEGTRPSTPGSAAVLPARRGASGVLSVIVLVIIAVAADILVTNHRFRWRIVGRYLFAPSILSGVVLTLELTALCMAIGIVLGTVLAVMRQSTNALVRTVSAAYIWFFRGTPVLVQLIFWYNLAALFPVVSIGVPFGGPTFAHASTNSIIDPFTAAILGLGLNEGAYMAEIVRGGIIGVDAGQYEAGAAIGMTRLQVMGRIVLPQAMRIIVPPTGNETIGMLKTTALVSVISLADLLYSAQLIYASNFQTIPLLITVSLWYLAITSVLTQGQHRLERRFGRGFQVRSSPRRSWPFGGRRVSAEVPG